MTFLTGTLCSYFVSNPLVVIKTEIGNPVFLLDILVFMEELDVMLPSNCGILVSKDVLTSSPFT